MMNYLSVHKLAVFSLVLGFFSPSLGKTWGFC